MGYVILVAKPALGEGCHQLATARRFLEICLEQYVFYLFWLREYMDFWVERRFAIS